MVPLVLTFFPTSIIRHDMTFAAPGVWDDGGPAMQLWFAARSGSLALNKSAIGLMK
jgi:hypothetical protein